MTKVHEQTKLLVVRKEVRSVLGLLREFWFTHGPVCASQTRYLIKAICVGGQIALVSLNRLK